MAMGKRIINEYACILIVFIIFAVMENCDATRHLLQTPANTSLTNTSALGVDDFNLFVRALRDNNIVNGNLTGTLHPIRQGVLIFSFSQNGTFEAIIHGTTNGVGIINGTVTWSNGVLIIFFTGSGPLNNITLRGNTSRNGTDTSLIFTVIGIATVNRSVTIPLSGDGTLTLLNVLPGGAFIGTLTITLTAIIATLLG